MSLLCLIKVSLVGAGKFDCSFYIVDITGSLGDEKEMVKLFTSVLEHLGGSTSFNEGIFRQD